MNSKKSRIPTISPERLDKTPAHTPSVTSYEDRKAKAFIKGREFIHRTSLRLPESMAEKVNLLSFYTWPRSSFNKVVVEALKLYFSQPDIKSKISKAAKKRDDLI